MVNIEEQITKINGLLTNHEISHRDSRTSQTPITDVLTHVRTTLITNSSDDIYNPLIAIYDEEYEDTAILERFHEMVTPTPLTRDYPYLSLTHLSELLTNITNTMLRYIANFTPPHQTSPYYATTLVRGSPNSV